MNRQVLAASIVCAACLVTVAPAAAEDLLLTEAAPIASWQLFDGPYVGASVGYGQGSPHATASIVFGQNFFLNESLYWGAEISGLVYNDGASKDAYALGLKLGTAFDRFTVYGMLGAGLDTNIPTVMWRATAGAEYAVTDAIGINAEVSSTQSFTSFGDVIQGQLGIRFHHGNLRGDPLPNISPEITSIPFVQSMEAFGDQFGIQEVRLGPALSNLELNPTRMLFEPDLSSFLKARLDTIQFDVIMRSPELFAWIGSPRPSLGGVINVMGYESMVHAGLNWQVRLGESPFYTEFGLGLGVHNGYLTGAPVGYRDLGCRVLNEWQYGAGYDVNDKIAVTATWKHVSGFLFGCDPNDGINTFGVTAGWKF